MLGEEPLMFAEGCQRDRDKLSFLKRPIAVGLDVGYLRRWDEKKRYFVAAGDPLIAGKSVPQYRDTKYFGFVDAYAEAKSR